MFDTFTSLGTSCPVASSMGKHGLRSFSGPFDWLVTKDFSKVLHFMETDFRDFLKPENLVPRGPSSWQFIDTSCDFRFLHDKEHFQTDYAALKRKYDRRIGNFMNASRQKTCYLRAVNQEREVEYIRNNAAYIDGVIRRNHPESELVLLFVNTLPMPKDLPFRSFQIRGDYVGEPYAQQRLWFDGSTDFLEFCARNYSPEARARNISIDRLRLLEKAEETAFPRAEKLQP